jgi:hypothetical protein
MSRLHPWWSSYERLAELATFLLFAFVVCQSQSLSPDQVIQVHNLPSLVARTPHSSDVLMTSLDTIFHDRDVCCGKDSALEDSVQAADPKSLKDVASKIQGRHLLSDGRPIMVNTTYLTPDQVSAAALITMMSKDRAAVMEWNSHIYVLYGMVFLWTESYGAEGGNVPLTEIHKLLLWDTRYSDSRREVVFNRETDDPKTIQGLLFAETKME